MFIGIHRIYRLYDISIRIIYIYKFYEVDDTMNQVEKCWECDKEVKTGDTVFEHKETLKMYCSDKCFLEAWATEGTFEGDE